MAVPVFAAAVLALLWLAVASPKLQMVSDALAAGDGDNDGGGNESGNGGHHGGGGVNSGAGDGDDNGQPRSNDGDDDNSAAEDGDEDRAGPELGAGADATRRDGGGDHYVSGEVVVANLGSDVEEDVRHLGFVVIGQQQLPSLGLTVTRLRVPQRMTAPAARTLLAARFPQMLVDVNAMYRPQGNVVLPPPDYPTKLIGWGHAPDACGRGFQIGMLDTAVDTVEAGLRDAHIAQRSFLPSDARPASTEHGTAIAEILVGQQGGGSGRGLLPGAELTVAGVFAADPAGVPYADVMALLGGLDWLASSGAPVINMSFSGDANSLMSLALQRAAAGGAIVVAAVGNNGPAAPPAFPAAVPGVIGVTAVDSRSQPYADANSGDYVDFAAPGVRIWTPSSAAAGRYNTGTSFAAPFVAAAAATLLAEGAPRDPDRIAQSLAATAIDLGAPGKDPIFGWGLIQMANPCSQPTQ